MFGIFESKITKRQKAAIERARARKANRQPIEKDCWSGDATSFRNGNHTNPYYLVEVGVANPIEVIKFESALAK